MVSWPVESYPPLCKSERLTGPRAPRDYPMGCRPRPWHSRGTTASGPRGPPAYPLPARESKFSGAEPAARWLRAFARWTPPPIARFESPMESKCESRRKNPQRPCHRAKCKTQATRHPAAEYAIRHPRGPPAACSAPVWRGDPDRATTAIPQSPEATHPPGRASPRTFSPSPWGRQCSRELWATIHAALVPRSFPLKLLPYSPGAAEQGSRAPRRSLPRAARRRATRSTSGSWLHAPTGNRDRRDHVGGPKVGEAASDGLGHARNHAIKFRAFLHRDAGDFHGDCRCGRGAQLPNGSGLQRVGRAFKTFRQFLLHQFAHFAAQT